MFTIRPADAKDHADLVSLWHQGWHDAHEIIVPVEILKFRNIDHFAIWLTEARDDFYVAVDTKLLGFVSIRGAEVVKLYVARRARGQDVARSLLSFAESKLSESGVREAELFCTEGNNRAENFYRRQGWTLSRTFEDSLWMPQGIDVRFVARTHRFIKDLVPEALNH